MSTVTITVKCSNDTKYTIAVDTSKTVLEFKQLIAEKSEIAADKQRLIYSGRVLKDNDTLETYKIAEGHTVHMVRSMVRGSSQSETSQPQPTVTSTTTNATNNQSTQPPNIPSLGDTTPNPFAALGGFGNFGTNNPYGGANLFGNMNFGGGDSGNSNGLPNFNSMEQVLNNPAFMQYISQLMQDPQFIDNVIAMNPQLGEMAPQLRQLSQGPEFQSLLSNPEAIRHMATLMGNNPGGGNPNTNQQQQQPFFPIDPSLLYGLGGLGVPPTTTPTTPQQPPEERFQVQLQQLNDMGFWDAQKNIRALLASGGNVNSAVELLLSDTFLN
nr:11515_t:CDS:2 [Entrophospora candida]